MVFETLVGGYAWFYLDLGSATCVVYQLQGLPGIQSFVIENDEIFPRIEGNQIMVKLSVRFLSRVQDVGALKDIVSELRGFRHVYYDD